MRDAHICTSHKYALVPLWTFAANKQRYDIHSRLTEILPDILSEKLILPEIQISDYDLWLHQRLTTGRDSTWLADKSLFASVTFCRLLGSEIAGTKTKLTLSEHAAGFDVAQHGLDAIDRALDDILLSAENSTSEPHAGLGILRRQLVPRQAPDPCFDVFRDLIREKCFNTFAFAAGTELMGATLPERRFHNIQSAILETGIARTTLTTLLLEKGALPENDPQPRNMRIFDARKYAPLLASIPTWVGQNDLAKQMNITEWALQSLIDHDVIRPGTSSSKVRYRWDPAQGAALIAALDTKSSVITTGSTADLIELSRITEASALPKHAAIASILKGDIPLYKLPGEWGFKAYRVERADIEDHSGKLLGTAQSATHLATHAFSRAIGLKRNGLLIRLIERRRISAQWLQNPRSKIWSWYFDAEDRRHFHDRFITLRAIEMMWGIKWQSAAVTLRKGDIQPFSDSFEIYEGLYLRTQIEAIFGGAVQTRS